MRTAVVRLVVALLLFGGWLGYLAYLVATRSTTPEGRPLVLSAPQFLVSRLDVIAEVPKIEGSEEEMVVQQVLYPAGADSLKGTKIKVVNLLYPKPEEPKTDKKTARTNRARSRQAPAPLAYWNGPGKYLLPLRGAEGDYEVVPIPPSPGYAPLDANGNPLPPEPRIYPATPQVLAQYRHLSKPSEETSPGFRAE